MSIGIYYVLFNAKFIELKYKILLGLVFTSLFVKNLLSRDNANYDKNILKMFERV